MPDSDVIGLIPCGGHATRLSPLPCSKEVLPIGLHPGANGSMRPKVVSQYLLERMRWAGIKKAFLILRKGKWDIPEYYGDGAALGMTLGYLTVRLPYGPAYTLDQAYPFVRGARVAIGFPDILFEPRDGFAKALKRLASTRADIVLGLCQVHDVRISDMIDTDRAGRVRELVIKPKETKLKLGWVFAVWTPVFTEFMHGYLAVPRTAPQDPTAVLPPELSVGHVIRAAIENGLHAQTVSFRNHAYLDIGTPDGFKRATATFFGRQEIAKKGHQSASSGGVRGRMNERRKEPAARGGRSAGKARAR